jgi:nucleoside 2-deoxyribosyltransferase
LKFYLSACYPRRLELSGNAGELRALGHVVTSSWHDRGTDENDDGHTLSATREARAIIITRDLADIRDSDTLIAFTEPPGSPYTRGTRHAEAGYAFGLGLCVWLVGEEEEMLLHWHPDLLQFRDWRACATWLETMKGS